MSPIVPANRSHDEVIPIQPPQVRAAATSASAGKRVSKPRAVSDDGSRRLSDADAYLAFLTAQPEVSAGPVAVTGYCVGVLLAVRTAVAHPGQVAADAAFHAPVAADGPENLRRVTARAHFGHAESDLTPEGRLAELNQSLDAAGVDHTSEICPGTVHGFTMADTDAFDPAAPARHWDRLLPLLDRTLAPR
ncbi:dienelactone hydrolase family protein [Streptomyces sp. WMMC897]|uniref:dienelactone hydrolase family protein n=1 Tax=Streptomyces sp. WMMC897 TaxID=3014782 RepID=UPI0022B63281|nr:dienelactone hydrolase family protein [Streptomyces sp. WMMC897]MCZ7415230.1 dienelactone hydrolase family protein [Streptomyces sp. WMMC897]